MLSTIGTCKSLIYGSVDSFQSLNAKSRLAGLSLLAALSLAGCHGTQTRSTGTNLAGTSNTPTTPADQVYIELISGQVMGGIHPLSNASVQLYQAGTAGDGSAAIPLLTTPLQTDSTGAFSISGTYSCNVSSRVYIVATGGNPGLAAGTNNPAAALMSALGRCGDLAQLDHIVINELTTVASVSALASFMQSYSLIGAGRDAADAQLFDNAFNNASSFVDIMYGTSPGKGIPKGQIPPTQRLDTLGDIVADCVNSSGGTAGDSSPCGEFFASATAPNRSAPTDTISAMLQIAQNPTHNVVPIYQLYNHSGPFQPDLTSAPADWTLAITSTVPTPTFSPAPGTYGLRPYFTLILSDTDSAAKIYYTTDGSKVSSASAQYSGAITLPSSATVSAVAIVGGLSSLYAAGAFALPTIAVALTPNKVTLTASQIQTFTATVANASNTSVTWSLSPAAGSISAAGLYIAPASILSAQTVTVTATSVADLTKSASGSVSLLPPATLTITSPTTISDQSGVSGATSAPGDPVYNEPISGMVTAGLQPLSNASVQLYQAGTAGDGSAATPLLSIPVQTDSTGAFSIPGAYSCNFSSQVYIVATGGNPGLAAGTNNQAAALMAALGRCGSLAKFHNIVINELTTVASVSTLASFMQSYNSVGSSTQAADAQLLDNAIKAATRLVDMVYGTAPGKGIPAGQVPPTQRLDTLGDIVDGCINSSGGTAGDASPCGQFFATATAPNHSAPTDTIAAMLQIAQNPTQNVVPIFELYGAPNPFQPALVSAPSDWTLEITSTVPTPTFLPAPGTYNVSPSITLADKDSTATIYYTTDGSKVTSTSAQYLGAITLPSSATISAVAIVGGLSSLYATGAYALATPPLTLTPNKATLTVSQTQAFTATLANVPDTAVTWSLRTAVGSISAAGLYTAPASITSPQTVWVTATSVSSPTASASAKLSLVPPTSVGLKLEFSTQPVNATPGSSINPAVVVNVEDAQGNVVAAGNYSVTLSLAANDSGFMLAGDLTSTAVNGQATFSNVSVTGPGTGYQLHASAAGLSPATSVSFAINPPGSTSTFTPPPANECQSNYDAFYGAEPGVIAYWAMCEPGTNSNVYDYIGQWSFIQGSSNFGGGALTGGMPGPVPDAETAIGVASADSKLEFQGFSLNKNAGTMGLWINADATAFPVTAEYFGAIGASSNVMIQTYLSSTSTICYSAIWTNSAGTPFTASQCGYPVNTWHRVVMTWTSGTLSLYVDGALKSTAAYSGTLNDTIFYYQLFPGCCATNKQMTLAKVLVANQAWSGVQVAQDSAPTFITPPNGGVYVSTHQLGTIHRDVLGYADNNQDLSTSSLVTSLKTGLAAAGVTSVRYAGGFGGISADLADWKDGSLQCNPSNGQGTTAAQNAGTQNNLDNYLTNVAKPLGLHVGYTVNYGTNAPLCNAGGDPVANGANLVQYANVTKSYGIKYWEIGNEQFAYGGSAIDLHPNPYLSNGGNLRTSYPTYEPAFYDAMKSVDPTIQIGVPVAGPGAYNAELNYGYPVFAESKYDAVVFHPYPIQSPITDANTLYTDRVQSNAFNFRGPLLAYQTILLNFGKPADAIWLTEWDGEVVGDKWSKQTVGAAAPLFVVSQLGAFMNAGIPYATYWTQGMSDFCGQFNYDYSGETAYGWWECGTAALAYTGPVANNGELPVGLKAGDLFPAARGFQVLSQSGFVVEGEHMLRTQTDPTNAPWLVSYAATHGSSYAVILINRDRDDAHTVPVQLAGKASGSTVTQWTYGRAQYDQTYSKNWSAGPVQTAHGVWSGTFQATLPPWSVSVLIFGN